ncbi:SET domain-containing protein 3 [Thecamonas trahens ATCC 50062]|uniref:SET domain-containing protein 3 n=1 Tax=Thecamonas trahens ATCC 50062 TaxID=461836 RepID=A0A0L0D1Q2_THETB|nr:SET domain-containing protein 3 [Thecamonas trahens ATCC 50062]KNC46182.1 SET domain-containing protein 3 [Thecamonas trahens ATCC 50062]|eukprot:XP_013763157.1 SET domain-containing protein 3 [Thecamonas trahens ATCC 50062]
METLLEKLELAVGVKTAAPVYDDNGEEIIKETTTEGEAVALARLVAELKKTQENVPLLRGEDPDDDAFAQLTDWLVSKFVVELDGGEEAKLRFGVAVGDGEAGNGLVANKPIAAGEQIVFVHSKLMMSEETALACPHLGPFAKDDKVISAFPSLLLALHVMQEATDGKSSKFAPYIAALPASFNTPLYWGTREFGALAAGGSPALGEAYAVLKTAVRQYLYLQDKVSSFSIAHRRFSWANFAWALGVVATRQNAVPKASSGLTRNLVDAQVDKDTKTQLALVPATAPRDFAPGEPITIFYGPRPNSALLIHSGFVPHYANHWDTYEVTLDIAALPGREPADPADPIARLHPLVLRQLNIAPVCKFYLNAQMLDPNMVAFVRLGCIDSKDDMTRRAKLFEGGSVSIVNDEAAYTSIRALVADLLATKPNRALDAPDAFLEEARFKDIARLILGEIELLRANLGFVDNALAAIAAKRERKRLARIAKKNKAKQSANAADGE